MINFSWDNEDMKLICGECHYKDEDPTLCHEVEPPIKKTFIPKDTSSCHFLRESYWQRIPEEQRKEFDDYVKKVSKIYYEKHPKE